MYTNINIANHGKFYILKKIYNKIVIIIIVIPPYVNPFDKYKLCFFITLPSIKAVKRNMIYIPFTIFININKDAPSGGVNIRKPIILYTRTHPKIKAIIIPR